MPISRHPLASVPALPVCAGTVAGIFCAVGLIDRGNAYVLPVAGCVALIAIALWYAKRHWPATLCGFLALGMALTCVRMPLPLPDDVAGRKGVLSGRVERVNVTPSVTRLIIEDGEFRTGELTARLSRSKVSVTLFDCDRNYLPGDVVKVHGRLQPMSLRNRPDIPYCDDYAAMARVNGVTAFMDIRTDSLEMEGYRPTALQRFANAGFAGMCDCIDLCGFDDNTQAFVLAVLVGDETFMGPGLTAEFRASGVAHILALSGLHVGIIAAMFTALMWLIRMLPGGRLIFAVALPATVILYGFCVGMPPSVARAAVMLAVMSYSGYLEWPSSPLNALFVTLTFWLYINPMWLWSPAMQLSCAALLGVIWFGRFLRMDDAHPVPGFIVGVIAVPVGAMTATSLLTVLYFHTLPVWFMPANIVTVVLMPVILTAAAVSVALVAVGLSPGFLPWLADGCYGLFEKTLDFFAGLPHAQITGIYPDTLQTVIFAVTVILIFWLAVRRSYVSFAATAMAVCVLVVSSFTTPPSPRVEVYIPASYPDTEVLLGAGGTLAVVTDGKDTGSLENVCRHLKGVRRCDSIADIHGDFDLGPISRRGQLLGFDNTKIFVLDGRDSVRLKAGTHITHLLVTNGFRGDIVNVSGTLGADTVLLPRALNARVRLRFERELREACIPVRDISCSGWKYVRN